MDNLKSALGHDTWLWPFPTEPMGVPDGVKWDAEYDDLVEVTLVSSSHHGGDGDNDDDCGDDYDEGREREVGYGGEWVGGRGLGEKEGEKGEDEDGDEEDARLLALEARLDAIHVEHGR